MIGLADLIAELPDDALDALAERLRPRLSGTPQSTVAGGWLDSKAAAAYLACTLDRIHDLVAIRALTPAHDGRRLLFRRSDLDRYVGGSR